MVTVNWLFLKLLAFPILTTNNIFESRSAECDYSDSIIFITCLVPFATGPRLVIEKAIVVSHFLKGRKPEGKMTKKIAKGLANQKLLGSFRFTAFWFKTIPKLLFVES